jgi:large subunit ribosomal protein L27
LAGEGTYMSRNFTIHAAKDGIVTFKQVAKKKFTGKTERRTVVEVIAA